MIAEETLQPIGPGESFPLDLLGRLVSLAAGSYDVAQIQAVNDHLADHYTERGFRVSRIPVADRGDLLIAERATGRAGSPVGRRVTIVGHSDTVWPAGALAEPRLRIDEAGSRWAGPGIGDMKAALLLAAEAASAAATRLADAPAGLVRLVVVPDEEVGSVGSSAEIARIVGDTDLCIGLEAGKPDGSFITSRGAVGAMHVEVEGVAAHVTEPGGINALDCLLEALARIRSIEVDGAQLSITRVEGGTARQIAAATASAWIDLRCDSEAGMSAAVAEIERAVASVQRGSAAAVRISGGQTRPAFPPEASRKPWGILGGLVADPASPPTSVHERGGSDASSFAAAGVPTVDGFGPVCFDNCAPTESIASDSVASRAAVMAGLIAHWSLSEASA